MFKEKVQSLKEYLREHQVACVVVACTAVAGITYIIMREPRAVLDAGADCPEMESTGSFNFSNRFGLTKFNNNTITTNISKSGRGHPGYITRCIETNELFETQGDAARTFNIPEEFLSKHLNYGRELADDLHFERIGVLA